MDILAEKAQKAAEIKNIKNRILDHKETKRWPRSQPIPPCESRRVFSNYRGNGKTWEIARTLWKDYESTRSTNTPRHWWGRNRPWNKNGPHHAKWGVKNASYKLKNDKAPGEDIVHRVLKGENMSWLCIWFSMNHLSADHERITQKAITLDLKKWSERLKKLSLKYIQQNYVVRSELGLRYSMYNEIVFSRPFALRYWSSHARF